MTVSQDSPLRLIRLSRGISLRQLAVTIGCDSGHLSRVERGEIGAGRELATRLFHHFGGEITREQILFPKLSINPGKKPVRSTHRQPIAQEAR